MNHKENLRLARPFFVLLAILMRVSEEARRPA